MELIYCCPGVLKFQFDSCILLRVIESLELIAFVISTAIWFVRGKVISGVPWEAEHTKEDEIVRFATLEVTTVLKYLAVAVPVTDIEPAARLADVGV